MSTKKHLGRPPKPPRSGTVTASIRHVDTQVLDWLRIYAVRNKITLGEAFSKIIREEMRRT